MVGVSHVSRRLRAAMVATLLFVVAEAAAGFYSNSLALLSDAVHNITDVIALGLSWYAIYLSTRPASARKTFGYHRAGILIALLNAATLVGIALYIFYEAYQRLVSPPEVQEGVMIVVAVLALLVNAGTAWLLHGAAGTDLNVRSAFVHLAGDAISTVGVLLAGVVIQLTGWRALDSLASILIGVVIAWSSGDILREGIHILLEGTPSAIDMDAMIHDMLEVEGVRGVHDLHAWSISSNLHALSAHVTTDDVTITRGADIQRELNQVLVNRYNIAHTALQLEAEGCSPDMLYCELGGNGRKPEHGGT